MFPLHQILERAHALYADRVAIADGSKAWTYRTLHDRVRRLAGALHAMGLQQGDRVAILAKNSFRYLEVNYACVHAGLILIPLNIRLAEAEVDFILKATETKLLLHGMPTSSKGLATLSWNDAQQDATGSYEQALARAEAITPAFVAADDIAQIFYTSGTTGRPKGVCLTHRNLFASAMDAIVGLELNERDTWLHASPMFHLVDAFAIWALSLVGGKHVAAHFEAESFGPLVARDSVTKTSLPPTLLQKIVQKFPAANYDLSSLKLISYGGSPMQEAVYHRCVEDLGCSLLQAYGLTEGSGFVCHQTQSDTSNKTHLVNTVGRPTIHAEVAAFDDDGQPLPADKIGELCVRGERVMRGYWNDPDATNAAFRDGWYRSGDLGACDESGQFRILGRKKEMIISGGENVYPAEVVNALISHPAVAEAAVFGVPSSQWGEEVRAIVYLQPYHADAPSGDVLILHCRSLIGGYKVPKIIEVSPEPLPKSGPGKIATAILRSRYLQGAQHDN